MKIEFEQKLWNRFVTSLGVYDLHSDFYNNFLNTLTEHNATHEPCEHALTFATEEDRLIFKIKFGL